MTFRANAPICIFFFITASFAHLSWGLHLMANPASGRGGLASEEGCYGLVIDDEYKKEPWYKNSCLHKTLAVGGIAVIAVGRLWYLTDFLTGESAKISKQTNEAQAMCNRAVDLAETFVKIFPDAINGLTLVCRDAGRQITLIGNQLNESFVILPELLLELTSKCQESGEQAELTRIKLNETLTVCHAALVKCGGV